MHILSEIKNFTAFSVTEQTKIGNPDLKSLQKSLLLARQL